MGSPVPLLRLMTPQLNQARQTVVPGQERKLAHPPRRIVVNAAIAHIEAIHDGVAQRPAALNYSAGHEAAYRNTVKE
jgi:hypothetical protein